MKTTTESQEPVPAAQPGSKKSDDPPDPDFDIGATGGPSDGSGDPNTRPVQPPAPPPPPTDQDA
jgi:hypothetical protein